MIFALLAAIFAFLGYAIAEQEQQASMAGEMAEQQRAQQAVAAPNGLTAGSLFIPEIELCLGKQLSSVMLPRYAEIAQRTANLRTKLRTRQS